MLIRVNGKERDVAAVTLESLLRELDYTEAMVATAVNQTFVRRDQRSATPLRTGDQVEILVPRQGG